LELAAERAADATRAANAAQALAAEVYGWAARAHEEAARTHERAAEVAVRYGGNIDAPWHRRAAANEREEARRAGQAAAEARRDLATPPSP